jgi:hypothetical protein
VWTGLARLTLVCLACESLSNRSILTCFKLLPGLVVHVTLLSILVYVCTVVIITELKMYILGTHFDIHSGQPDIETGSLELEYHCEYHCQPYQLEFSSPEILCCSSIPCLPFYSLLLQSGKCTLFHHRMFTCYKAGKHLATSEIVRMEWKVGYYAIFTNSTTSTDH